MKIRTLSMFFYFLSSLSLAQSLVAGGDIPWGDARTQSLGGLALAAIRPENGVFLEPAALAEAPGILTSFSQERFSAQDFSFDFAAAFPLVPGSLSLGVGWDNGVSRNEPLVGYVRDNNGQFVVDPVTGQPQTVILGYFTQEQHNFY